MSLPELFETARRLGPVKVVVRNRYAVMERIGVVAQVRAEGAFLHVAGSTFGLVLDTVRLGRAFALEEERSAGPKRSIVLPALNGAPAAKLVLREGADLDAFERLRTALNQGRIPAATPPRKPTASRQVVNEALEEVLATAASLGTLLEITVRNACASLRTQSVVHQIRRSARAPWINVVDPALHLHLFEREIVGRRVRNGVSSWLASDGSEAFTVAVPNAPTPQGPLGRVSMRPWTRLP